MIENPAENKLTIPLVPNQIFKNLEDRFSPEQIEKIKQKIQDVSAYGTIYHMSALTPIEIFEVIKNGFKSRYQLQKDGLIPEDIQQKQWSYYPTEISFLMNTDLEVPQVDRRRLDELEQQEDDHGLRKNVAFILNTEFIEAIIKKGLRPFIDEGTYFDSPVGNQQFKEFLKLMGWNNFHMLRGYESEKDGELEIYKLRHKFKVGDLNKKYAWSDEILLKPELQKLVPENPVGGIMMSSSKERDEIIRSIEEIVQQENSIQNAPLVYDEKGNLIWPTPISNQEIKRFLKERDANKYKTYKEGSSYDEMREDLEKLLEFFNKKLENADDRQKKILLEEIKIVRERLSWLDRIWGENEPQD